MLSIVKYIATPFLALMLICAPPPAMGQAQWPDDALKRYTLFAPERIPTSYALAYRWQMRIDLSHQLYFKKGIKPMPNAEKLQWTGPQFLLMKLHICRNWRLGINLTPWNRITLGAALATNYRGLWYERNTVSYIANISNIMAELQGTFHDLWGNHFAYEIGYSIRLSKSNFYSKEIPHDTRNLFSSLLVYDCFEGKMVGHSLTSGISAFNSSRSLQATLQLNADFIYFTKRDMKIPNSLYDVWRRIRQDRGRMLYTPSLLFSWHATNTISLQTHIALPITMLDGHLYAPCPAWGVQISFRTIKTHRHPNAYIDAP